MNHRQRIALLILLLGLSLGVTRQIQANELAPTTAVQPQQTSANLGVFEEVWRTVHEHFYEPTFHGLDWTAVGEKYRLLAAAAGSDSEQSTVINRLLSELAASHTGY